jgi:YggT family protein
MHIVWNVVGGALTAFFLLLIVRWIVDLVLALSRDWRPSGAMIVVFEIVYTVTDPPLKALRRVIPPLRIGRFALDLSFIVLLIGVSALINVVGRL